MFRTVCKQEDWDGTPVEIQIDQSGLVCLEVGRCSAVFNAEVNRDDVKQLVMSLDDAMNRAYRNIDMG